MTSARVMGHVDESHRLSALVPDSIPPGRVAVIVLPFEDEDDAGAAWMEGIAQQWSEELGDARQDIYTLEDGEPVDES